MFDFKKIENIVAGIQSHMADQKKQREAELLASLACDIFLQHKPVATVTLGSIDKINISVDASIAIAQEIIVKSRSRLA